VNFRVRHLLVVGLAAVASACASTGATPRPFPGAGTTPPRGIEARPAPDPADAATVTRTALAFRGTPYRNGGADPDGFDCSGFTQYVFWQHGIALPRDVKDQFEMGRKVKPRDISPGDLVFFSTVARGASHVGIALGDDEFVHAPSSKGVVRVERIGASYWSRRFVGARRLTTTERSAHD
jgi:cell wall-associated NlpC family hydrolase